MDDSYCFHNPLLDPLNPLDEENLLHFEDNGHSPCYRISLDLLHSFCELAVHVDPIDKMNFHPYCYLFDHNCLDKLIL